MKSAAALLFAALLPGAAEAQERKSVAPASVQAAAPPLADYTDEVLFGDVWLRPGLSPRDRSLVTLSALIAGGNVEQLKNHFARALDNGVTPLELSEAVTHLAFYAGWPRAVSAANVLAQVFEDRGIRLASATAAQPVGAESGLEILRAGSTPPRSGPANLFTGDVQVSTPFSARAPGRTGGARVIFQAGARTAWHSHPLGQILIVTEGIGRVQVEGGPVEEITSGDVVWIPAGKRHWHGAAPSSAMTHFAIAEMTGGKSVDWMEQVPDAAYRAAPR